MRKETQKIVGAFMAGKSANAARTSTDGKSVFLHGNKIFWRDETEEGVFHFSLCGWPSATTRERINALLGAVWDSKFPQTPEGQASRMKHLEEGKHWYVCQRNGAQFLDGGQGLIEIDPNDEYMIA